MTLGCNTPEDVAKAITDNDIQIVDIRFTDLPGMWQHTSYPATAFDADNVAEGLGFDGSSIRGFQEIEASDMLLLPDPTTAFIDPFTQHKTLVLICDIHDPVTKDFYPRDPRGVARRAEEHLKSTGLGDRAYFGPEAEFFVFDDVRYGQDVHYGTYAIDSVEGHWNMAEDEGPNLAHKIRPKEGYFPVPPSDSLHGSALRDGVGDGRDRHRRRVPPSRGRHRGAVRDRHALQHPGVDGRRPDQVQVCGQERRPGARQDRDLHAQATVRRQWLGHARSSVDLERRYADLRRSRAAMLGSAIPAAITLAAC